MSNQEVQLNEFGMEPLKPGNYVVYRLGNFASQLSWMMVSTYLSIFYTDVFGLGTGTAALRFWSRWLTSTPGTSVDYL